MSIYPETLNTGAPDCTPSMSGLRRALDPDTMLHAPVADLEGDAAISASKLAGRTLARLHAQLFRPQNLFGPGDELVLLRQWVDLIEALESRPARDFRRALVQRRLERCFAFAPDLVADDGAVLIDFDTAASSDPAQDNGNFLAHFRLRELQAAADRGEQAADSLDGYARERRFPDLAIARRTLVRPCSA